MAKNLTRLADLLWIAEKQRNPIAQPSEGEFRGLDIDGAYHVQTLNRTRRLSSGEKLVGRKIGLTSRAMQLQLGVDEPDYGILTDSMRYSNNAIIQCDQYIAPRLEAEFAFRLGQAIPPNASIEQIAESLEGVALAIEIIDSRIEDWQIALVDTIADNASSAGFVVGPWLAPTSQLLEDILDRSVTLCCDGVAQSEGVGRDVLGDPLLAVQWLADSIAQYGDELMPGEIVLAGAVSSAIPLTSGKEWSVCAEGFGTVGLHTSPLTRER